MAMVAKEPRVTQLNGDSGLLQYDMVQRSKIVGFPDTVTVRFIPLGPDRSTLAIYSRSHYGRRDFGVNRERITDWLSKLGVPGAG